ncbi:hypothetical protein [Thiohalomonas denitrificans]|uniref:Uncharacterized protein n=1 Tax=Thiohalomonas denitrificans TaxID=415747 RepID=A0A1G5PIL3_9GAMM|nr:hypothetical protein [Thiohalomonas denitrificans]SCZ49352.1 hypothetical protein SAMN03097708_00131 [Thiohalomonas denitrificans]
MAKRSETGGSIDRVILLFLFAILLLVSPLKTIWAADDAPWYLPYLLWGALIILAARLQRRFLNDEI